MAIRISTTGRSDTMAVNVCLDYATILSNNGVVVENLNGSVSVFVPDITGNLAPVILTKTCCEIIKPNYFFDIDTQQCRWSSSLTSTLDNSFKLILNPKGNDGTLFYVENDDNCSLSIDFDYLFKIKCETLVDVMDNSSLIQPNSTNSLQLRVSEETANINSSSNKILELIDAINNTPYTIVCEGFTPDPIYTEVDSTKVTNFGRTGFGVAPFSFGIQNEIKTGVNYALTDGPNGLSKWEEIIGSEKFIKFKNGDPSSYTCSDIQTLYDMNTIILNNNLLSGQQTPILMFETDIPFGTRTNLIEELNALTLIQGETQGLLTILDDQIKTLTTSTLTTSNVCQTPVSVFENLDISVTIDVVTSANTLETVFEHHLFPAIGDGNLYDYLRANTDSGFYVCGDPTATEIGFLDCTPLTLNISALTTPNVYSCDSIINDINQELLIQSGLSELTGLTPNVLASRWLHYNTIITDPTILASIANKKIKLSFKVNNTCSPFCLLIDEIILDKVCTHVESNNIFLTQSPGFNLERISDNKKSWVGNTVPTNRPFVIYNNADENGIRQTNYDVNDERLVINTKEIDLDINIASAIENDVWCYIRDNGCILSGISASCVNSGETIFTCPSGYEPSPDNTNCINLTYTGATFSGTLFTVVSGSKTSIYSYSGANFYENITNLTKPLEITGTTDSSVYDGMGNALSIVTNAQNNFWGYLSVPVTGLTSGRLNNAGIWSSLGPVRFPLNQWIGHTVCIDLETEKTYYLGIGCDNYIRVKLNGELIIDFETNNLANFTAWHVFPLTLQSGLNIIELEGLNTGLGAAFAAEIYDADLNTLTGATTTGQTNLVFSTAEILGGQFLIGVTTGGTASSGYSCPVSYALDNCSGGTPTCVLIDRAEISVTTADTITCCGDKNVNLNLLLTSELSGITTIEEFEKILTSELINVKSRKTISSYPTLRLLYDRYLNSSVYCGTNSSGFNYKTMDQFANMVGDYWIDIVEQVVPATTIWDSVKIYSNTIFDRQKFKYKSYTSLFCGNPFSGETVASPINGTSGTCANVSVSLTPITTNQGYNINPIITTCNSVCIAQMNKGSEFIGSVTIIGESQSNGSSLYAN